MILSEASASAAVICQTYQTVCAAACAYTSIQAAVNAIPATPLAGDWCIDITDNGAYAEQVTVQGKNPNGFTIYIGTTTGASSPTVSPPAASTAAFVINNASVTLAGINILGTNAMSYGVQAASAYVTISSVNVDSGGNISVAGVYLSSWSSLSNSSITVQNAYGLDLAGSNSFVSNSTMTNASAGFPALWLPGSSYNTVTQSHIANSAGTGAYLFTNSNYNTVSRSAMTGGVSGAYALWLVGGAHNTITQSVIGNPAGTGARLDTGSNYNTIGQSTMTSNAGGFFALLINAASSNTITQSYISNPSGDGASLVSSYNTISQSTLTSSVGGSAALFLSAAFYNTITQSYLINPAGNAANVFSSNHNTITLSTLQSGGAGGYALYLFGSSSNTISQSALSSPAGYGAYLFSSSNCNAISQSTLTSASASCYSLYLQNASDNRITQSSIDNPAGYGAFLFNGANRNTISQSTMTSGSAAHEGLHLDGVSSTTVVDSYIQGSTAACISGSTGTVINSSVLVAADAFGSALIIRGGSVSLAVASTTLRGGPSGRGLLLDLGNAGVISIGSVTVTGAARGLEITTQAAGFVLAVDSVTFRGLTAGATAIDFLGGTFVSTFTLANFEDAGVGANISGAALGAASRITMNAHRGPRRGPAYENDPNSLVDWQDLVVPPSNFAGAALSTSSLKWTWTDNSDNETGFRILAGALNVSGDLPINATSWLQAGLGVNASSGSLRVQAFTATATADSGALTRYSLAAPPSGLAASSIFKSSATLTWTAGNPAGTIFELERSTGAGFGLVVSTALAAYANTGLSPGTTYYYRVRALNGDSAATAYSSSAAVPTPVAAAPNAPSAFAGVAQSTASILWTWTDNSADESGFRVLTGTVSVSGDLAINATAWLQTGLGVNAGSGPLLVQAFNSTGTADSGSVARYSLAAEPSGLASSSVFQTSATLTWTAGNPAGTIFELERSTGGGFILAFSSAASAYTDTGLTNASTHFYRVRALNGDSAATAYASTITVATQLTPPPGAPTGFAGAAL
ncbi:MAG: right-handed parallel beta-helix repeat-containing protein, partial [Elusimicrobia bacterium]|nr:right-handed parallel beta-helix repeat-containing protein [Elusimicrobiota bacterium]